MEWIQNLSFRYRILLGCVLVALIPLAVSSVITLQVYDITLHSQSREEGALRVEEMNLRMEELFEAYDEATRQLADNPLVIEALEDPDEELRKDIYLELYRATDGLRGSTQFFLYDAKGILCYTTETGPTRFSLPLDWGLLRKAANAEAMICYGTDRQGNISTTALMKTARVIRNGDGEIVGYAVVNISEETFSQITSGLTTRRSSILVADEFWGPVYAYPTGEIDLRLTELRSTYSATGTLPSVREEGGYNYQLVENKATGYFILLEQTGVIPGGARETMQSISLGAGAISLILCVWISILLSRGLVRPVRVLNDGMAKVRAGNLDTRIEFRGDDELGQLSESFNQMTMELQTHVDNQVQRQKDLNDAQIRLLQAQLNPHFLYNTLDTMKWLAKINNVPEVAAMASNLAVILRKSISGEQFVTLRQELDMIESYIDIQRIRFPGRFQYVLDIPPELEDCVIPKLILQPLVENAILHGLQNSESGYLYVYVRQQEDLLRIAVTDDGHGMAAEMVERLNSGEPKILEGHLGLYNVGSIIHRYYGPQYGLHASAKPGIGTTVEMLLPVRKEEENAESGGY